jgi:hypothetical protein
MTKIVILSAGPGLPEIVTKYGHSSDWIPKILSNVLFWEIQNPETHK